VAKEFAAAKKEGSAHEPSFFSSFFFEKHLKTS
jgi:hypothetical protein